MRRLILPSTLLCLLGSPANALRVEQDATGPGNAQAAISLRAVDRQVPAAAWDFWSADPLRDGAAVIEPTIDALPGMRDGATLHDVVPSENSPATSAGVSALISFTLAALLLSITLYVLMVVSQRRRYVFYLAPVLATATASLLLLVAIFGNPLTGIGIFGAPSLDGGAVRARLGPTLSRAFLSGSAHSGAATDGTDGNDARGATFQTVPEPSSAALLACGLGGILRIRRQRSR